MLNKEKYKDEIIDAATGDGCHGQALKHGKPTNCSLVGCEKCDFYYKNSKTSKDCVRQWKEWCEDEYEAVEDTDFWDLPVTICKTDGAPVLEIQIDDKAEPILADNTILEVNDSVNHPHHYESGNFECFDVILATQGKEATENFCICNAMKYIYRHKEKNGLEDIEKAKWYIDRYIELQTGGINNGNNKIHNQE